MPVTEFLKYRGTILVLLAGLVCFIYAGGCTKPQSATSDRDSTLNKADLDFGSQADRPPTPQTLYSIANILAVQGRDSECEYVLNRIIRDYPEFSPAYNSMAELQMRQRRVNQAVDTLTKGLKAAPRDPVLLNNLGMCHIIRKDYQAAAEMFSAAAGVAPQNARYRANMAVAFGLMGRDEESLSLFEQVLPKQQAGENLDVLHKAASNQNTAARNIAGDSNAPR